MRGRGLKPDVNGVMSVVLPVAPHAGAGIETYSRRKKGVKRVALMRGRIETIFYPPYIYLQTRRPSCGAWIETSKA